MPAVLLTGSDINHSVWCEQGNRELKLEQNKGLNGLGGKWQIVQKFPNSSLLPLLLLILFLKSYSLASLQSPEAILDFGDLVPQDKGLFHNYFLSVLL